MALIPKILGICGNAVVGKDTFCNDLCSRFPSFKKFSLADELKLEVRPKIISDLGIDILNCTPAQKEIVRPHLVEFGTTKRRESNNRHWINKLIPKIQEHLGKSPDNVALVSDVRYFESDNDEVPWVKKENNGILVHISQYKIVSGQKVFKKPANSEEERNDPLLVRNANYRIIWPEINQPHFTFKNTDTLLFRELSEHIEEFLKYLRR